MDSWKKAEARKVRTARRKQALKQECATRAASMLSLGPVSLDSVEYFKNKGQNFETAKVSAVKEFLQYNLNYSEEELCQLTVAETRLSTKGDDIINVALSDVDEAREVYVRKAESRNDNLIVRSYIPPNFHERFMALNRICAEKRKLEPNLKTQLRFGRKDVEVFTKLKGEDGGYRKVSLEDFTNMDDVPEI